MPCRLFCSNNALPDWELFDSKLREILGRRPENLQASINVNADRDAVEVSVWEEGGQPTTWRKTYSPLDKQTILADISKEFGV